ncbi:hypothetical protein DXG03_007150 [Asterophora parasitica]|uniref:asparaginase n=1 Tax=Asterophora parasitica TaxID=117018 RepID=A0A9P7KDP2_9AGAR|nr:hypothetical protein DXG03_007150 [Asterophora parasitica]
MAYSSSALSFMLEDLGKTVILTGAQIPMSQLRNDAVDNLMGALTIAGHYIIPECCLYFNHTLYRGNRVSKMSSYDLSAFGSPNFSPLVNVGIDIVVNWNEVIRQTTIRRFRAHKSTYHESNKDHSDNPTEMSPHVATLRLFPGIATATIKAFFMPPIRGVVLETFGAGNAPQRADLMEALKEACNRGVVVVAITQCAKGSVSDAYETGRTLLQAGVVSGNDMTPECALTKLSYLLSKPELSVEEIRELISTPLRGELTRPIRSAPSHPATVEKTVEHIEGVLSEFVRLTSTPPRGPQITVTPEPETQLETSARDATAPWTLTVAEAANTEAVLIPFLIHLAAARDDLPGLQFSLAALEGAGKMEQNQSTNVAGGVVNCLDPATGKTPLHSACVNGSARAAILLLRSGALVHLRDSLGHTALYYAARQGHEEVVDLLVQAGATLGGFDEPFAALGLRDAVLAGNKIATKVWLKTGIKSSDDIISTRKTLQQPPRKEGEERVIILDE